LRTSANCCLHHAPRSAAKEIGEVALWADLAALDAAHLRILVGDDTVGEGEDLMAHVESLA